ncbi:MAG TPA: glycosyltransferase, partial [Pirellulales bacterium]|nr:glycosyltransferase [Pirellulales bacterium]
PFDRRCYRAGSSGTLAEALAAGCPAVVPAGTWMARQLPAGGGEMFDDYDTFLQAVRRLIDGFDGYRRQAESHRASWLARHSPDAVVAAIVGGRQTTRTAVSPTIVATSTAAADPIGSQRAA